MLSSTYIPLFDTYDGVCYLIGVGGKAYAYQVISQWDGHIKLYRDGLMFTIPQTDPRIRTGFEADFPLFEQIDWGRRGRPWGTYTPTPVELELEEEAEQAEQEIDDAYLNTSLKAPVF